jgi:hypothetical protein
MKVDQKISCSVQSCIHYKRGDMCSLNAIQVMPCDDQNAKGHESLCYSYQRS